MKRIKAFTLVETLIVIVVFCIGILTVLFWLSQTLKNKDHAKTQIQSAFFAREWIELMFNLRDANYHKELPWNCIPQQWMDADWCKNSFKPDDNKALKISIWSGDYYIDTQLVDLKHDFDSDFEKFQIYFHTWSVINGETWFIYDYVWTDEEKTRFARYIQIKDVDSGEWKIDPDKLLKIESHVLFKKWALTWEKVMETFIWNYDY